MRAGRVIVVLALAALVALSTAAQPAAPAPLRVLLVGNSLTYFNEMPRMLAQMASAPGATPLRVAFCGAGGLRLENQWERGEVVRALGAAQWDVVVLQGQSVESTDSPATFLEYGRRLDGEIRRHGARTVLFLTWAVEGRPQEPVTSAYLQLSRETGATVAPVGPAFASERRRGRTLLGGDDVHPNLAGSYLAACVLYAVVTGRSPVGLTSRFESEAEGSRPAGVTREIPPDLARELQHAALDAVASPR
jgi:hypothetical protein